MPVKRRPSVRWDLDVLEMLELGVRSGWGGIRWAQARMLLGLRLLRRSIPQLLRLLRRTRRIELSLLLLKVALLLHGIPSLHDLSLPHLLELRGVRVGGPADKVFRDDASVPRLPQRRSPAVLLLMKRRSTVLLLRLIPSVISVRMIARSRGVALVLMLMLIRGGRGRRRRGHASCDRGSAQAFVRQIGRCCLE